MKKNVLVLFSIFFMLQFMSCGKSKTTDQPNADVNNWVYETMSNYYYWNKEIPSNPTFSLAPEPFFNSLLYNRGKDDRFSWIINSAADNSNMLHGVNQSFGFEYALTLYNDPTSGKEVILGIVLYTLPNSPISATNVKRGDVFYKIDGEVLTKANYQSLLSKTSGTYSFINNNQETFDEQLAMAEVKEDPVFYHSILNVNGKKMGYLVYNQFTADNGDNSNKYKTELLQVFSDFKSNNINELVLDLRYNHGGLLTLSTMISSLIVPNVDSSKVALNISYNDLVNAELTDADKRIKFSEIPNSYVGGNLTRLFVLTGNGTASASEAVINCLKPYMPVVLIGQPTYGKNVGSVTFTDEKKRFDWAIQPIIMKLYNSKGESDYTAGFVPDYLVNELNTSLLPLGDENEPLLQQAISIVSGIMLPKSKPSESKIIIGSSLERKQNLPMREMTN